MSEFLQLLLLLIAGHYLADFPLQPEFVAKYKSRVFIESIGFHCLTAHAMIHALVAGTIAGVLGYDWLLPFLVIGISHWIIDFGKAWDGWPETWRITQGARWSGKPDARGLYGINVDQGLHGIMLLFTAVIMAV